MSDFTKQFNLLYVVVHSMYFPLTKENIGEGKYLVLILFMNKTTNPLVIGLLIATEVIFISMKFVLCLSLTFRWHVIPVKNKQMLSCFGFGSCKFIQKGKLAALWCQKEDFWKREFSVIKVVCWFAAWWEDLLPLTWCSYCYVHQLLFMFLHLRWFIFTAILYWFISVKVFYHYL